ncbi:MAG: protein YgfX [Candidatus Thiodiazotropha sp.]
MGIDLPSLNIEPESSRLRRIWWLLLYLVAGASVALSGLSWGTRGGLFAILLLSGVIHHRRQRFSSPSEVVRVVLTASGWCRLYMAGGRQRKARLRGDSFVSPWLIVLRFDLPQGQGRPSLVLFRDALDQDRMRRLRIILGYIRFPREDSRVKRQRRP